MKLNGKNNKGKQKYKCKNCKYCFVKKNVKTKKIRGKGIFNNWLVEGYSARQLSLQSGKTKHDIQQCIRKELDNNELYQIDIVFDDIKYVMIDGTWITSDICLIVYYEYVQKKIIRFGFYDGERYEYIKRDLIILKYNFKYDIVGFTVDGGKQIKKAVDEIYPNSIIQRCLTHVFRQIKINISQNPQSDCGKELQKIITFENFKNEQNFIKKFTEWEEKWFEFLKEKSSKGNNYWYTHRKLRASRSHIKNAIPYMFLYLSDENIKRSSNALEGFNGVLSDQIKRHRGLRIDRLISFISLWIYQRNL